MSGIDDKQVFELSSMPPSVNVTRRADPEGKRKLKRWLKGTGWEIKEQRIRPITGPFAVYLEINPALTEMDIDNGVKAILDLLHVMRMTDDDRECVRLIVVLDYELQTVAKVTYHTMPLSRAQMVARYVARPVKRAADFIGRKIRG